MSEICCFKCGGNLDEGENEWSEDADGHLISESFYCENCGKYIRLEAIIKKQKFIKEEDQQ